MIIQPPWADGVVHGFDSNNDLAALNNKGQKIIETNEVGDLTVGPGRLMGGRVVQGGSRAYCG